MPKEPQAAEGFVTPPLVVGVLLRSFAPFPESGAFSGLTADEGEVLDVVVQRQRDTAVAQSGSTACGETSLSGLRRS